MGEKEKLAQIAEIEKLIKKALNLVDKKYYFLKSASIEKSTNKYTIKEIIRERFFCYELYHQMRLYDLKNQILNTDIVLSAEISKNGHDIIENNKVPDFIIHKPGNMDDNLALIEVKGTITNAGIAKDYNTLSLFLNDCSYLSGIFILFNHKLDDLEKAMPDIIAENDFKNIKDKSNFAKIRIFCKESKEAEIEETDLEKLYATVNSQTS